MKKYLIAPGPPQGGRVQKKPIVSVKTVTMGGKLVGNIQVEENPPVYNPTPILPIDRTIKSGNLNLLTVGSSTRGATPLVMLSPVGSGQNITRTVTTKPKIPIIAPGPPQGGKVLKKDEASHVPEPAINPETGEIVQTISEGHQVRQTAQSEPMSIGEVLGVAGLVLGTLTVILD